MLCLTSQLSLVQGVTTLSTPQEAETESEYIDILLLLSVYITQS